MVQDGRERQFGDDYLLLAAHAVLESYILSGQRKLLLDAIVILEFGLEKSKFNYDFKILLFRVYSEIGVAQRTLDLATSLEVKNIQLDTLRFELILIQLSIYRWSRMLRCARKLFDAGTAEYPFYL